MSGKGKPISFVDLIPFLFDFLNWSFVFWSHGRVTGILFLDVKHALPWDYTLPAYCLTN